MYRGVIFDLDGVIVDTAGYHYQFLPDVLPLLEELRRRGVRIALCSAGKNSAIILKCLDLEPYFDSVVDGAWIDAVRPDPEGYLLAAEKLGLTPWECAVFEDSVAGLEAARSRGMYAIGVGNPKTQPIADLYLPSLAGFDPDTLFIDRLWYLPETVWAVEKNRHYEGAFTTGSGYLSIRGSLEEGLGDDPQDREYMRLPANVTLEKPQPGKSKWGTYVPGIVGCHPLLNHELINLPWFLEFRLTADGEPLDMETSRVKDYSRYLNMKDGTLHRGFRWVSAAGAELAVLFDRFVSMETLSLSVQRLRIRVLQGAPDLAVEAGIDARVRTNGYNHFNSVDFGTTDEGLIYTEVLTDHGNAVLEASALECPAKVEKRIETRTGRIFFHGRCTLGPGESLDFAKYTAVASDRDLEPGNWRTRCEASLREASIAGYARLHREHAAAWRRKWETCDVAVEGDDEAQLALRFSIYHMIRADAEHDPRVAICAKGHAGESYYGRFFWDNDLFVLPFFIYTNPEAALNLILFRCNTLTGAKENAVAYGYRGARYPWESSIHGREESACWQYGDHEVHVTADVVYALWHYFRQSGGMGFLKEHGLEVLVETARYWVDRVDRRQDGSGCDLMGVMGPDEYLPFTRNNAYTNAMVRYSLERTLEALSRLQSEDPDGYRRLLVRLDLKPEEITGFKAVRDGLAIPFDPIRNLVLQSEDFDGYAEIDLESIWKDRSLPFGYFISQEKNYRSKALKQADVLMLMLLLPDLFTAAQMEAAYDYYEPITTHDSSLSATVHAIIAARLGRITEAERYFRQAVAIDLDAEKCGCNEGIHIANAGGLWQAAIHGFAGIKNAVQSDVLTIDPRLPSSWRKLECTLIWRGQPVHLGIDRDAAHLTNLSGAVMTAEIRGKRVMVGPGETHVAEPENAKAGLALDDSEVS